MTRSLTLSLLTLNAATDELDDCVQIFGLPGDAGVPAVREAAMARMANGERAAGQTPNPTLDPVIRAQRLEAEGARLGALYRARRLVLGYNAQAEAIQDKLIEKIDDGAQAGRSWSRFLATQAAASLHMARSAPVGDALIVHSDEGALESLAGLEDLVTVPEAGEAA